MDCAFPLQDPHHCADRNPFAIHREWKRTFRILKRLVACQGHQLPPSVTNNDQLGGGGAGAIDRWGHPLSKAALSWAASIEWSSLTPQSPGWKTAATEVVSHNGWPRFRLPHSKTSP